MARLNNMITDSTDVYSLDEALIEALKTLIEMVEADVLTEDEVEILEGAISFITEDFDDVEEALTEKRMSAAEKMAAKKYRMKNKAKLKAISKKKAKCQTKIAGKDGYSCNSKGQVKKVDKARSRAAKIGARSR